MKHFFIISLLMLGALMTAQTNGDKSYIEVSGKAERYITPDEIFLSIVISEERVEDFKKLDKKTMDALRKAGVAADKITMADTQGEDISLWYKKGFETRKSLWIELATAQMVNEVMMAMHKIGVDDVRIARVDYSKKEALQDELRVEAMRDAQRKSALMLEAVGAKQGNPILVRENQWGTGPVNDNAMLRGGMAFSSASAKEETAVSFKKLKYKSDIFVRFEIKD